MQLSAIYAGLVQALAPGVESAILKQPVETAEVGVEGITIDRQADRRVHGGPDQALHQYSLQSYAALISAYPQLNGVAHAGTIGENLTVATMADDTVCIGDVYQFGPVVLQVSQPRRPCSKINLRYGVEGLSRFIEQSAITGWYFRVLEPGTLRVGDPVVLRERAENPITVARFMRIFAQHRPRVDDLDELIACRGLSREWRERLINRRDYLATLAN